MNVPTFPPKHITASTTDAMLMKVWSYFQTHGVESSSRNGPVLSIPWPMTLTYSMPTYRVLRNPERRANPFLHFFDGLFAMTSFNQVSLVSKYAKSIANYSDDGISFNGHYGTRLRNQFRGECQLTRATADLRKDPNDRRVVLSIWDPYKDESGPSKDYPCNLMILPRIVHRNGNDVLDITVFNRSNDVLWGALGANVVQFTMIQEVLAAMIGVGVGAYHQISNNLHMYKEFGPYQRIQQDELAFFNPKKYAPLVPSYPMVKNPATFLQEIDMWFSGIREPREFRNPFFYEVVTPMEMAFDGWNTDTHYMLSRILAPDWRRAVQDYIAGVTSRREAKKQKEK